MSARSNNTLAIPTCFFPTTAVVIDTSHTYLETSKLAYPHATYTYETFSRPWDGVHFLNDNHERAVFLQPWLESSDSSSDSHCRMEVSLQDVYKEVYNPNRFSHVSSIMISDSIERIDVLELLDSIQNPFIQKIMRVYLFTDDVAELALRQGRVNFVVRSGMLGVNLTEQALIAAQQRYFQQVMSLMGEAVVKAGTAVRDPLFVELFEGLVKKHKIVEYYQFGATGSFIMLDAYAKLYTLFTYTEDKVEADCIAVCADPANKFPESLKQAILRKEKMLCRHALHTTQATAGSDWEQYVLPANVLETSNQRYYYAFEPGVIPLDTQAIVSFKEYKKKKGVPDWYDRD